MAVVVICCAVIGVLLSWVSLLMRAGLHGMLGVWLGCGLLFIAGMFMLEQEAKDAGFQSIQDQSRAHQASMTDADAWSKRRASLAAEQQATQLEAERRAKVAEWEALATAAKSAGFNDVDTYRTAKAKGYATKKAYDQHRDREAFFNQPSAQRAVVAAIAAARTGYKTAANDLARGGMRAKRKRELCRHVSGRRAKNWIGKITQLTTNGDGHGVVAVSIGDTITVKTWNNAVSDAFHKTLIDPATSIFQRLTLLKEGDRVKFSGRFFKSDVDCVHEASLTLTGSMSAPEFIIRFTKIRTPDAG